MFRKRKPLKQELPENIVRITAGSEDDFHSAVGIHEMKVPTQEIRTW